MVKSKTGQKKMSNRQLCEIIKEALFFDSVGSNKAGNVVVRNTFFYTHGGSAEKTAEGLVADLKELEIDIQVIDKGEVWRPFNGGASVRASSHWWVEVSIK